LRNSVSFLPAIQATGFLTFSPADLSPTEHASLAGRALLLFRVHLRPPALSVSETASPLQGGSATADPGRRVTWPPGSGGWPEASNRVSAVVAEWCLH
jgi:hypothetical protein